MRKQEDPAGRPQRAAGAFFGRRKGKTLRPAQRELYERLLPALRIDLAAPPPERLAELFPGRPDEIRLEIGFGGGEHLAREAGRFPSVGFIGAEPFVNGVAKMLSAIDSDGLTNIRLHDEDATSLLDWLPAATIDRVDLLYPDPWPKKRHWKRRFVNPENLGRIARVLKPGGEFRFASDIDSYVNWTLRHVLAHPGLEWMAQGAADWRRPWEGWRLTRYEAKARREGRDSAYLIFRKTS